MVVIVFGLPGSGKSYFASRLAKQLRADYVNSDQVRIDMVKQRQYTEEERMAVYDKLFERAQDAIQKKTNLVIDATFFRQDLRQRFVDEMPQSLYFIEIVADKKVAKKRLSKLRPFSEADFEVYKIFKKSWEPMKNRHLVLESTDDNIGEMIAKARLYILGTHDD